MSFGLVIVSAFVCYYLADHYGGKGRQHRLFSRYCRPPAVSPTDIVGRGRDLNIHQHDLHRILTKRFFYYRRLNEKNKSLFLFRLQQFMRRKIFIIKDDEGVREMPVLVSASAVQLTFGLPDYPLSFYRFIRIYPAEFVSDDCTRILAGNVSGNIISVAWNHFLHGYHLEADGANLGLHEMSHALYFQKVEVEQEYGGTFRPKFQQLHKFCLPAFEIEIAGTKNLYSKYAEKNMQEFWAESVELFFEKPLLLQEHYPDVFQRMIELLNQSPVLADDPVVQRKKAMPLALHSHYSITQTRQRFSKRR